MLPGSLKIKLKAKYHFVFHQSGQKGERGGWKDLFLCWWVWKWGDTRSLLVGIKIGEIILEDNLVIFTKALCIPLLALKAMFQAEIDTYKTAWKQKSISGDCPQPLPPTAACCSLKLSPCHQVPAPNLSFELLVLPSVQTCLLLRLDLISWPLSLIPHTSLLILALRPHGIFTYSKGPPSPWMTPATLSPCLHFSLSFLISTHIRVDPS